MEKDVNTAIIEAAALIRYVEATTDSHKAVKLSQKIRSLLVGIAKEIELPLYKYDEEKRDKFLELMFGEGSEEVEKDVCSKCGLVELELEYPYYHCEECRGA
jgi:hypothetical protein